MSCRLNRTFSSLLTMRLIFVSSQYSEVATQNMENNLFEQSIVLSPWSVSASTENTAQVSHREAHLRKGHWKSMISLWVCNTPTPLTFSLTLFENHLHVPRAHCKSQGQGNYCGLLGWIWCKLWTFLWHRDTGEVIHVLTSSTCDCCSSYFGINQASIYCLQLVQNAAASLFCWHKKKALHLF